MSKFKKGTRLSCLPCGREVVVSACGVSTQTIWCCGKPMAAKKKKIPKSAKRRTKKK